MTDKSKLPIHRVEGLDDELNEVLNYNNITNCITEIPQDIKLELNNETLTLKAGSKLYIPNGFETDGTTKKFDTKIIESDISLSDDTNYTNLHIFYVNGHLERILTEQVFSGTIAPTSNSYMIWYDTKTNKIKKTNDSGNTWTNEGTISLSLGLTTTNGTGFFSIDQIFNGIGFIGSIIFALPNVKGLAPNGRNENGTLKNNIISIDNVLISEPTNTGNYFLGLFSHSIKSNQIYERYFVEDKLIKISDKWNLLFNTTENIYYASGSDGYNWIKYTTELFQIGKYSALNGKVTNIDIYTSFQAPNIQEVVTKQEYLTENEIQQQIFNRIYDGRDLTKVFADEIANYSDEWAWIKARIASANYDGLYVGDYIPVTMNAGTVGGTAIAQQTFQCQIAGIDTYTGCGDVEIGHHIDFISREVINTAIVWNPVDNNNGTSVQANPWLASNAYAWLNGVNNYTTSAYNNVAHGGNYANAGILQLLPTKLSNLIVTKRNLLDSRYDSTKLLTYSTGWAWGDMGKLWLPNELEAYGFQVRSNLGYAQGYWNPEANIGVSYPIYANSGRNRIKRTSTGGRSSWWLSSAASITSTNVCRCDGYGDATSYLATNAGIRCPLCFRIA